MSWAGPEDIYLSTSLASYLDSKCSLSPSSIYIASIWKLLCYYRIGLQIVIFLLWVRVVEVSLSFMYSVNFLLSGRMRFEILSDSEISWEEVECIGNFCSSTYEVVEMVVLFRSRDYFELSLINFLLLLFIFFLFFSFSHSGKVGGWLSSCYLNLPWFFLLLLVCNYEIEKRSIINFQCWSFLMWTIEINDRYTDYWRTSSWSQIMCSWFVYQMKYED